MNVCLSDSCLASKPVPSLSFHTNMVEKWRWLSCVLHSFWRSNHLTGGVAWCPCVYIYKWILVCLCGSGLAFKPVPSRSFPTNMAAVFRITKLYLLFVLGLLTKLSQCMTLRATTSVWEPYRRRSMGPMRLYERTWCVLNQIYWNAAFMLFSGFHYIIRIFCIFHWRTTQHYWSLMINVIKKTGNQNKPENF